MKKYLAKILFAIIFITYVIGIYITSVKPLFQVGINENSFFVDYSHVEVDDMAKAADEIMQGHLIVRGILPSIDYDSVNKINWGGQYSDSPNSFQVYLQSLTPIVILVNGYKECNEYSYLKLAYGLVRSWDSYRNKDADNPFVWYDHGVAMRTENLIYLYIAGEEKFNLIQKLYLRSLIKEHGEWLFEDDNYYFKHNHGMFEDEALLYAAYFLNDSSYDNWIAKAEERLEGQISYAFNDDGVHVENAPAYQDGVMNLLYDIMLLLQAKENDFSLKVQDSISNASVFMTYVTKPNGRLAEVGDSSAPDGNTPIYDYGVDIFGDSNYLYAATQGELGDQPVNNYAYFQESGYYISHNSWETYEFNKSTWQLFKAGYCSRTHKHADDNSFMLYSKGYDIFVDPGYYSYMTGNRYSDYLRSAKAHNTVIVDNKSYSVTEQNSEKTGLIGFEHNDNYDYVLGFNDEYAGVGWDRAFYNLGEGMILHDTLTSSSRHSYSQLLHLSEDISICSASDHEIMLAISDSGYYVHIIQENPIGHYSIHKGDFAEEEYGYISKVPNEIRKTITLKYDAEGSNLEFITLITIEDKEGNIYGLNNILYDNSEKMFYVNGDSEYKVTLSNRETLSLDEISITKKDLDRFVFTNDCYIDGETEYCWYVISKATAEVLYKTGWSKDNSFEYQFTSGDAYLVKAYIKSSVQKKSKIVAEIDCLGDTCEDVTLDNPYLNLDYIGNHYEIEDDGSYTFYVDYNYSWDSTLNWYIYKNGGSYDYYSTKESWINMKFDEPGLYTVMYYLNTVNGDSEFWNFEEIEIK